MGLHKRIATQQEIDEFKQRKGQITTQPPGPAAASRLLPIELKARIIAKYFNMTAQPSFVDICDRILERYGNIDNPRKWAPNSRRLLIEKFHAEIAVPGSLWDCGKSGLKKLDKRKRRAARKAARKLDRKKPPRRAMAAGRHQPMSQQAEWIASGAFLESYEWRRLRVEVLKRYGPRCMCCGAAPKDGVKMHVDHIKPRRKYPELALRFDNLQVLCEVCNHGKGNWDETDWRPDAAKAQPLPS